MNKYLQVQIDISVFAVTRWNYIVKCVNHKHTTQWSGTCFTVPKVISTLLTSEMPKIIHIIKAFWINVKLNKHHYRKYTFEWPYVEVIHKLKQILDQNNLYQNIKSVLSQNSMNSNFSIIVFI